MCTIVETKDSEYKEKKKRTFYSDKRHKEKKTIAYTSLSNTNATRHRINVCVFLFRFFFICLIDFGFSLMQIITAATVITTATTIIK